MSHDFLLLQDFIEKAVHPQRAQAFEIQAHRLGALRTISLQGFRRNRSPVRHHPIKKFPSGVPEDRQQMISQ